VTNATVTSATLSNVTAAVTSATTTTENVTTMYVQTLITGSGLPGTGNGGGDTGWPSTVPVAIPPASDIFSGYIPPAAVDGLPAGSGTGIGNPAQNYLLSGGGGSDININGSNPTINMPESGEIPVMNPNAANDNAIHLNPDEYEIDVGKASLLEIALAKIGGAAYSLATMDPTGVTAMIIPWLLDNTAFGQKLQQGGTVLEAAEESAKTVRELPATIAKNYQELVDAQYKAVFGKDTKELGADAEKALGDLWDSVKSGVLDPIGTKVTEIADAFNEAITAPKTKTVTINVGGGGGGGGTPLFSYGIDEIMRSRFGYANGLFSVPWDGYPAILHKGERVLTARENQQYTYNNYFGNVSLNNGLEIDALTDSIARRNQRQRSGFGAA
jgi:hypothetical protein